MRAATVCTLLAACSDDPPEPAYRGPIQQQELAVQTAESAAPADTQCGRTPVPVAPSDPAGGFLIAVDARGAGCPAGSWDSSISSDGQTFTTTFSAYEVEVTPEQSSSSTDCTLVLKLQSPQGLAFSVTSLFYGGYGYLEEGVRGSFSVRYGFRGRADLGRSWREEYGPYDGSFLFEDRITQARRGWSSCASSHDLTVRTQLSLNNDGMPGTGYVNLLTVDGDTKLVLGLSWRRCRAANAQ